MIVLKEAYEYTEEDLQNAITKVQDTLYDLRDELRHLESVCNSTGYEQYGNYVSTALIDLDDMSLLSDLDDLMDELNSSEDFEEDEEEEE